jgi:hypothetical protein
VAIDDPLEQIERHNRIELPDAFELAVDVASLLPGFGLASIIRQFFSSRGVTARLQALFEGLCDEYRAITGRLDDIEKRLSSAEAANAVVAAITETAQTNSPERIEGFSRILARTAVSGKRWSEAETFIRNIARFSDEDAKALQILATVQGKLAADGEMPTDPNFYTGGFAELAEAVDRSSIRREEFYSLCSRLTGFGLAAAVERNVAIVSLRDECFRITSKGLRLARLISDVPDPKT